ncbi:MFS transporter [Sphingobium xenophagum]|uniref:MFS transporter n=1 Tax=Sphingobium xenophagum TaxID=121428 RepID=UPI00037CAA4D|nr:MFS transporter [Sphingobium xenophagum]
MSPIFYIALPLILFVHALDRGALATSGPQLFLELGYTNTAFGLLLSAYFFTNIPGQFAAGWLIDRIGAYRTLAAGLLVFSMATLLTGLASSFIALLGLRLLVGLGECASFPASSKLIAQYLPAHRLGISNALVGTGLMLGNAGGLLLGGFIIAAAGWRAIFYVFGALSLMVLVISALIVPLGAKNPAVGELKDRIEYSFILRKRELWGATFGHFAFNYPYFLLLSWMPTYLVRQHGLSFGTMGLVGGAFYLLSAIMGIVVGVLSDHRIAAGADPSRLRKQMLCTAGVIMIACMLACALGTAGVVIAALLLYSVGSGLSGVTIFAAGQTLAGPLAAGRWMALQNGLASFAGVLAPILTGLIIDLTGYFQAAFVAAAVAVSLGIICWTLIIRRIERIM